MTSDEAIERIEDAVQEPASLNGDGISITAPAVDQQIKGIVFAETQRAIKRRGSFASIKRVKFRAPGAQ